MKVTYLLLAALIAALVLFTACSPAVDSGLPDGEDTAGDAITQDEEVIVDDVQAGLIDEDEDFVEIGEMI